MLHLDFLYIYIYIYFLTKLGQKPPEVKPLEIKPSSESTKISNLALFNFPSSSNLDRFKNHNTDKPKYLSSLFFRNTWSSDKTSWLNQYKNLSLSLLMVQWFHTSIILVIYVISELLDVNLHF